MISHQTFILDKNNVQTNTFNWIHDRNIHIRMKYLSKYFFLCWEKVAMNKVVPSSPWWFSQRRVWFGRRWRLVQQTEYSRCSQVPSFCRLLSECASQIVEYSLMIPLHVSVWSVQTKIHIYFDSNIKMQLHLQCHIQCIELSCII